MISLRPYPPVEQEAIEQAIVDGVAAGEERVVGPVPFKLPSDTPMSDYEIYICADCNRQVLESDENNNCLGTPLHVISPYTIDLQIEELRSNVAKAPPGGYFSVYTKFSNKGNTNPRFSIHGAALLSQNPDILTSYSIAGYVDDGMSAVGIPADTAPGNYFLGVCADWNNYVPETDEGNNCRSIPFEVTGSVGTADLSIQKIQLGPQGLYQGDTLQVSLDLINVGADIEFPVPVAFSLLGFSDHIYQSWQGELGSQMIRAIPAGKSVGVGPFFLEIPINAMPGTYQLTACVDPTNDIIELDETNNCLQSGYFEIDGLRDLLVSSIQLDSPNAELGKQVQVSYVIKRNGYRLQDPIIYISTFLSSDATITSQDTQLSIFYISGFSDSAHSDTLAITAPFNFTPGTYYLGICVDQLDWIREADESNNCLSVPITFTAPADPPRLSFVVQSIQRDIEWVTAGDPVNLFFGITNNGSAETGELFVSAVLDVARPYAGSGVILGHFTIGSIPAGASQSFGPIPVQIPQGISGSRYIYLSAAATNSEYSSKILNYMNITSVPPAFDLRPYVGGWSARAIKGLPFHMQGDIRVDPRDYLIPSTWTSIRWSADETITSDDLELTRLATPIAMLLIQFPVDITFPESVNDGFIGVCADATNAFMESDESNNCVSWKLAFSAPDPGTTDLSIQDLTLSSSTVEGGDYVSASYSLSNKGANPISLIGSKVIIQSIVRWSQDPIITDSDSILTIVPTNDLQPGETRSFDPQLLMPSGLPAGRYYIGICLSYPEINQDWNKSDNCVVASVMMQSPVFTDLKVSNIALDKNVALPGDAVWVSFGIHNSGNFPAPVFESAIRWSQDQKIDGSDLMLRRLNMGKLDASDHYDFGPFKVEIPANAPPGFNYLAVCADSYFDASNKATEINERNNCATAVVVVGDGSRIRPSRTLDGNSRSRRTGRSVKPR